jgi:hypothetical protein
MTKKYVGRMLTIKSTGLRAIIKDVKSKPGRYGISSRFITESEDGQMHELMPHEVKLDEE